MSRLEILQKLKKELILYKKYLLNVIAISEIQEKDTNQNLTK